MHLKEEIAEAEARNAELTKDNNQQIHRFYLLLPHPFYHISLKACVLLHELRHSMGCGWRRRVASDELRCDHWRRAPGVTWLWMMEDAAFGDELRCDVARGHRRTWPPAMSLAWGVRRRNRPPATSLVWGVAVKDEATGDELRRGAWTTQNAAAGDDLRHEARGVEGVATNDDASVLSSLYLVGIT
uniref:Uncharacterized protein n=1 Tax=Oryza rufipogon TaxID=4529 RepID=A0A0E0QFR8_ORYRU